MSRTHSYCFDCGKPMPRRAPCAACSRERRRLMVLHDNTMDTSRACVAERERRVPVYAAMVAAGLPLPLFAHWRRTA